MKKILLATALLGATLLAQADGTVSYGDWKFNYEGTNSAATLVSVEQQGATALDMTSNAEGVTVTAMRSTIFDNCTTLADLVLPSTLTGFVEDPQLFKGEFIGETGAEKHLNCGQFEANPDISVEVNVKSGTAADNSYNEWGNTLFAFGKLAFPNSLQLNGVAQLYYTTGGVLRVVLDPGTGKKEIDSSSAVAIPFTVNFHCANGGLEVTGTDSNGNAIEFNGYGNKIAFENYTINSFDQFSYGMGTGMNANVEIINNSPRHETPQFARTAVSSIKVAEGNTSIKAEGNGTLLYTADNSLIYRPLTDCGSIFTIADNTNHYFYTAIERTMAGQLGTGDGNNRRVNAGEMSSAIAPGSLFALASTPDGGGFKITCLNSDRQLEFGGKANGDSDFLDVCISQWSQPYLTTFLGENTYVLSTRDNNYLLYRGPKNTVRLAQNVDIKDEIYHLTIKAAEGIELTFGDDGYVATTLPVAVSIPDGVKVFEVIGEHNGEAALYALEGVINANTPFLAYCTESTQLTFPLTDVAAAASRAAGYPNLLRGYPTRVTGLTAGSYFVLNPSSKQFEKSDATQTALGVPYILASDLPDFTGSTLALPESEPTSITEIEGANNISNAIYDLQGRRLTSPRHGLNIINGRKVLTR